MIALTASTTRACRRAAAAAAVALLVSLLAPAPAAANDFCESPAVIGALPFDDTRDTTSATTAESDPTPSCGSQLHPPNSVWYRFTPTTSGLVTAFTTGSDYDTLLAVYTGSCGALVEVACNDDVGLSFAAQVTLPVTAGTTYLFEVAGFGDSGGGNLQLGVRSVRPADNDECRAPTVITHLPFADTVDARAATTAPDDPVRSCSFQDPARNARSLWYSFTSPSNGMVKAHTVASSYDTVLTAYTGTCGNLTEIACNDDAGNELQSQVEFPVVAGTTYVIEVTDFGAGGGGTLHVALDFVTARAARGVQLTPDGKRVLVNKDVGAERWAISLNEDGSATGNVFRADGGDPAFIFCAPLGPPNAFACSGADPCRAAGAQRGVQETPDGKRVLVNKDVGTERWAISLNDDGSATGNVFRADGGEPAFIFCAPLGPPNAFACSGADACVTETCIDQYVFIADVTLPSGFFDLPVPCNEGYTFIADVTLPANFFSPR